MARVPDWGHDDITNAVDHEGVAPRGSEGHGWEVRETYLSAQRATRFSVPTSVLPEVRG